MQSQVSQHKPPVSQSDEEVDDYNCPASSMWVKKVCGALLGWDGIWVDFWTRVLVGSLCAPVLPIMPWLVFSGVVCTPVFFF